MTDRKIAKYNFEMAEHANGAAQYLGALLGGRYVTKEQTRDLIDFLFAGTKKHRDHKDQNQYHEH